MKKFIVLATACVMACSTMFAQGKVENYKQQIKDRKEYVKLTGKALDTKIAKVSKASAKQLTKQGWMPMPGELPIVNQIDKQLRMAALLDESGNLPLYFMGTGEGTSFNRQGAYTMASANSKADIAGLFETEVSQVIDQSINDQQNNDEYNSMRKLVSESTQYIKQSLKSLQPVVKMYRERDGKTEVQVIMACESKYAKEALFEKMEQENKALKEKLEKILETAAE